MEKPRKSTGREVVETAVAGAAGSIPVVGSVLAAGLTFALTMAHNRRMDAWFDSIAERIDALEDRPSWEELAADDAFVDVVIEASRVAAGSAQEEKLAALRNAVVNTIRGVEPDEDLRSTFLRYVDEMTPTHLALLEFMSGPGRFCDSRGFERPNIYMGSVHSVLEAALPSVASSPLLETAESDLDSRRLIHSGLKVMMTGPAVFETRTKPLGDRFLRFITDGDA
ncbi:hypothetical protein LG324_03005 [Phycicoccus jejuensis]|uniref:hypothetical protein n=1 Tax=Phycicoccus jejuensis TaxID=367299 RepID=UPI00384E1551